MPDLSRVRRWLAASGIRFHLAFFAVFFALLGLSMILQPAKWTAAPSFVLLVERVPVQWWGIVALAVAALKAFAAFRYPLLAVPAITAGSMMIAVWAVFFAVSYAASPPDAAPWAVLSSAGLLYTHLRTLAEIDIRHQRPVDAPFPPNGGPGTTP